MAQPTPDPHPQANDAVIRAFLTTLWRGLPERSFPYLWTNARPDRAGKSAKQTYWCSDLSRLVEQAITLSKQPNVNLYVGMGAGGTEAQHYSPGQRLKLRPTPKDPAVRLPVAIPGVWFDIDIADAVHEKPGLPQSLEAVQELLNLFPYRPTLWGTTGHGVHAYWLFEEPLVLADAGEVNAASALLQRWQLVLRAVCESRRYAWDATHDLTRVMRVLGTVNYGAVEHKDTDPHWWEPAPPVASGIVDDTGPRWPLAAFSTEALAPYMLPGNTSTPRRGVVVALTPTPLDKAPMPRSGPPSAPPSPILPADPIAAALEALTFDPKAEPDEELWYGLQAMSQKADLAFKRDPALKLGGDGSPSTYDMVLANEAALAGWPAQEICNLLIKARRVHKDSDKSEVGLATTVGKALQLAQKAQSQEEIQHLLIQPPKNADEARERTLKALRDTLGVQITRFVKYDTAKPTYRLETELGPVEIPSTTTMTEYKRFHTQFLEGTHYVLPRMKQDAWDEMLRLLYRICEVQSVGVEATVVGRVAHWVGMYLEDHPPLDSKEKAFVGNEPFVEDRQVFISIPSLEKFLLAKNIKTNVQEIGPLLDRWGAERVQFNNIRVRGKVTSRAYWRVPVEAEPSGEEITPLYIGA